MQVLKKSHDLTYRSLGGSLRGDLDHIIASKDLEFEEFSDANSPNNPHKNPSKRLDRVRRNSSRLISLSSFQITASYMAKSKIKSKEKTKRLARKNVKSMEF